ncbi:Xaa-Pro peptidase family protein [Paraburkholderia sediminicola]|uniref:Xaa-Pro peptidase family protein n=1 Tax=Paraburkholderia metrosideri TaxID=580937 RepID=A0ABW9DYR1_9BURK
MLSKFETDVEGRWPYTWDERERVLELEFPVYEYRARLEKLRSLMDAAGIDIAIIYGGPNSDANVRYLTGWSSAFGDSFAIVSTKNDPIVITNSIFHGEPMHSNIQTCWVPDFRPLKAFGTVLKQRSIIDYVVDGLQEANRAEGRVGYVGGRRIPAMFDKALREKLPKADLVDVSDLLFSLRRIKSPLEIQIIRKLAVATSAGMEAALGIAKPGFTECDLSAAAQKEMAAYGCELNPLGPKCVAGVRSAMKNVFALPGKVIKDGDLVSIDLHGQMCGYISDHNRSTVAGKATSEQIRLLEACAEAEEAGIRATGPGVMPGEIIKAMSAVVSKWGFSEWDWCTGHGFGLTLVEDPLIIPNNPKPLEAGQTFFIEPMIVPTHMGCSCFEDPILVTENGAERLTTSRVRTW